jgi:lambda repressor-like predicted transcriptional regulator
MKPSTFAKLALAGPRAARIAAVAFAACGAALASTAAQAGYSFETINDPLTSRLPRERAV